MIKNPLINKSRNSFSYQFKNDKNDFLNDPFFFKKYLESNLNRGSEKNINKYGFSFSMGLKVLKGNNYNNKRKDSKIINNKILNVFKEKNQNNNRLFIKTSKTVKKKKSKQIFEKSLNNYINQKNEFIK